MVLEVGNRGCRRMWRQHIPNIGTLTDADGLFFRALRNQRAKRSPLHPPPAPGGQAALRMQAGGTSCPLGERWADEGKDMTMLRNRPYSKVRFCHPQWKGTPRSNMRRRLSVMESPREAANRGFSSKTLDVD